jgi:hypothetical protein
MSKKQFILREGLSEDAAAAEHDHEVQMARADCFYSARDAIAIHSILKSLPDSADLEGWVTAKITLAADYLKSVKEYLEYQKMSGKPIDLNDTGSSVESDDADVYEVPDFNDFEERFNEAAADSSEAVASAITNRIMRQHVNLFQRYTIDEISAAIQAVADSYGELDEIGTSDVSIMVKQVIDHLQRHPVKEMTAAGAIASVDAPLGKPRRRAAMEQSMDELDDELDDAFDEPESNSFWIALYDEDENSTFVGEVSKVGSKWIETGGIGSAPYNWGSRYMGYLNPDQVMQWIQKDYSRGYEVGGPFESQHEAKTWAEHEFGPVREQVAPAAGGAAGTADASKQQIAQNLKKAGNQQLATKLQTGTNFNKDEVGAIMAASKS